MSYNVDTWKLKKLRGLMIPLASFFKHERKDWHPKKTLNNDGTLTLECGCEQEIVGRIEGERLMIVKIDMAGEGSGTFINWILGPALEDSTGELEAVCVWEGGDTINRLKVKDGAVEWEDVEL